MTDDLIARLLWMAGKPRAGDPRRATSPNLLDVERKALLEAADKIQALQSEVNCYRWALEFYAADESWDALDFTPVIGHRWDHWCYGGEVAQWALEGVDSGRIGFEGQRP
jgi:hypothetical protein